MLEQIAFGFQLVVPLFLVMLVGGLFRQRKIVSDTCFRDLNYMVFHLFLPSNVFYSIATADRSHLFEPVFGILILAGLLIPFFLGLYLVPKLISTPAKRGVVVQSLVRGNFVIVGLSLLQRLYGDSGLELVGIILLISMPIYNITSIYALEGIGAKRASNWTLVKTIVQNPIIVATFLGMLTFFIPVPDILMSAIRMFAAASSTIAIFALGGLLELKTMGSNRKILNAITLIRLVLYPIIAIALAYLLQLPEKATMTLMIFFGSPVAIITYAMVQKSGGDEDLAGQIILYTTAFSLFSYAFWIGIVRYLFQIM